MFILVGLCCCKFWLSLDEKYLSEVNEYLRAKVQTQLRHASLPSQGSSWQPDYRVDHLPRSLNLSHVTLHSLNLLAQDFQVIPGSMVSAGKANYTCHAAYDYYDHLEKHNGNMTVNTTMHTRVTISNGREDSTNKSSSTKGSENIMANSSNIKSRVNLAKREGFLENDLDRLYRAWMQKKVQESLDESVAAALRTGERERKISLDLGTGYTYKIT